MGGICGAGGKRKGEKAMEDLQLSIDSHGGNPLDRQPYYNDYVDSSADCPADKMSEAEDIMVF